MYDPATGTLTIDTDDVNDAGSYDLRINVAYEGSGYSITDSLDFTVNVVDPCLNAVLTIGNGVLSSLDIVYPLYSPADSETLVISEVTSSSAVAACRIELNIVNQDNTAIDTDFFNFNPATNVFTIESNDIDHLDIYNLKVTAKYVGTQYTNTAELPFKVTLLDHCATATLTIDPSILNANPIIYTIARAADI